VRGHGYRRSAGTTPRLVTAFRECQLSAHAPAVLWRWADPRLPSMDTAGAGAGLLRRLSSGLTRLGGPSSRAGECRSRNTSARAFEQTCLRWLGPRAAAVPWEVTCRAGQPRSVSADFAAWRGPGLCATGGW